MDPSYTVKFQAWKTMPFLNRLDTDENGKKSYKLITVTNRINEHIADYATD
jgi:hypothetical protein